MAVLDEWKVRHEIQTRTIEALLLGFNKEIKRDHKIPGAHNLTCSVKHALGKICGTKNGVESGYEEYVYLRQLKHPERIDEKILGGIVSVLNSGKEENLL